MKRKQVKGKYWGRALWESEQFVCRQPGGEGHSGSRIPEKTGVARMPWAKGGSDRREGLTIRVLQATGFIETESHRRF